MGGQSTESSIRVTNYHLDMLLGVCWGPVTLLREVWFGEKRLFGTNVGEGRSFNIYEPDLFGGQNHEGGAQGAVWFLPGGREQLLPTPIADMLYNRPPDDCPGYRNICCIALTKQSEGEPGYFNAGSEHLHYRDGETPDEGEYGGWAGNDSNEPAFIVGSNNPYLKTFWVEVTRASDQFFAERALIYRTAADRTAYERGDDLTTILGKPDSNLVHVLFEALTNDEWGCGIPFFAFDFDSWKAAAQTAYDELLGGSFLWTKPMTGEKFSQMVADHLRAMIFPDTETGLISIKLIRPDYDEATLPVFTAENSRLTELSVKDMSEVVNEVMVEWTNPDTYETESVQVQDLASIADLGERITEKHTYSFFNRVDLAWDAASRDVLTKTAPTRTMEIELPPSSERRKPGDVVRVQFPEEGADDIVARVMRVKTGNPAGRMQTLTLLEDVLAQVAVIGQEVSGASGTPASYKPLPPSHVNPFALPYYLIGKAGIRRYREGEEYVGILAAAQQTGAYAFKVSSNWINNVGNNKYGQVAEIGISRRGTMAEALSAEGTSVNVSIDLTGYGPSPEVGDYLFIGDQPANAEIALIEDMTTNGLRLRRGIMDTVPVPHTNGTTVWLVAQGTRLHDPRERAQGESPTYDLQTMTFNGTLPVRDKVSRTLNVPSRAEAPLRPANVRIEGSPQGGANSPIAVPRNFRVTWSNRNRLTEDNVLLGWHEGAVSLEPGATITVRVDNAAGQFQFNRKELTGGHVDLDMSGYPAGTYTVRVWSERDGLDSFKEIERVITIS
jgi:hypothetical protein